jgi:hypothetical protein
VATHHAVHRRGDQSSNWSDGIQGCQAPRCFTLQTLHVLRLVRYQRQLCIWQTRLLPCPIGCCGQWPQTHILCLSATVTNHKDGVCHLSSSSSASASLHPSPPPYTYTHTHTLHVLTGNDPDVLKAMMAKGELFYPTNSSSTHRERGAAMEQWLTETRACEIRQWFASVRPFLLLVFWTVVCIRETFSSSSVLDNGLHP